jgi:hypothetical protein
MARRPLMAGCGPRRVRQTLAAPLLLLLLFDFPHGYFAEGAGQSLVCLLLMRFVR